MFYCHLFFITDPTPTEIYTLSLHDALPILSTLIGSWRLARTPLPPVPEGWRCSPVESAATGRRPGKRVRAPRTGDRDRKSTRLNSSHPSISYAVFCLKKKTINLISCELSTY